MTERESLLFALFVAGIDGIVFGRIVEIAVPAQIKEPRILDEEGRFKITKSQFSVPIDKRSRGTEIKIPLTCLEC